jgi:hypothetical protein
MATTLSLTTTYAGQFEADEIILEALLSNVTLANNGLKVRDGIKKSWTISKLTSTGLIANRTCDFTDIGTVTMTERVLTPKDLEVNLKLCKDDFRASQFAMQMGAGRNNEKLAESIRVAMLAEIGAQIGAATEVSIWHGNKANAGEFDGIVTRAAADAAVIDVTGTAVTAANVFAELAKVRAAIPVQLRQSPDMKIYISPQVASAFQEALGAAGYRDESVVGAKPLNYLGLDLFATQGLSTSYMVAAESSNLWFGTDLMGDLTSAAVKFIDQSDIDGSNNVNFVSQWAADTNYGVGSEVVLYTPA